MKSSQSPTGFEQNNHDVTSIPGYVIEKNSSRGAKHGLSEPQRMYSGETDAEEGPSEKARTPPNDTFTMVRQPIVQRLRCQPSGGEKNT